MPASWGAITAQEIRDAINGVLLTGDPAVVFNGISTDSRGIAAGDLFWALRGETFDGHDFVRTALEKGAFGMVVETGRGSLENSGEGAGPEGSGSADPVVIEVEDTLTALGDLAGWWRRRQPAQVVGITGSSGKTTTKEMTAGILELGRHTLKTEGNFNNLIGLPLTLLKLTGEHECGVVEMGMNRPGEIARLTDIADPDVGVILNVGMAHLEGVAGLEGVARAKTELIERIAAASLVILNGDDALLMQHAAPFDKPVMTFGLGEQNDVRAARIEDAGPEGTRFRLEYQGKSWPMHLRSPGFHHLKNALAASAVSLSLNASAEHIARGLKTFRAIKGRFEVISLPGGVTLVDDTYNANPSSLAAAMGSVASLSKGGRIIVGLGDMLELGDAAAASHSEAGRKAAEGGAFAIFVMGAYAQKVMEGARVAGMPGHRVRCVDTHGEMAKAISDMMSRGDRVLLKGSRRMQLEKVVEALCPRSHGA